MLCYQRKTSFIGYYINGIKSRSIGVVKQCLTEENLKIAVDLFGLEDWKSMRCQVSIGNARERQPVFEMDVCNGLGKKEYSLPVDLLCKMNDSKIFFALGNDCYGIADLCEVSKRKEDKAQDDLLIIEEEKAEEDQVLEAEKTIEAEVIHSINETESDILSDCLEPQPDKWEVFKKKYPILYPFRGQGPYVSIKPVDLQLLDEKYHNLAENSFLMHAFYQYRHMILGEYEQDGSTYFYVGVPGEFVKKEQTSAAMFGFEGYEHSGDLGYYLYRVEL